ncbi:DUF596 domain-containing protein [Limnobaculum parvum]|uniref:DUF596 domain-containing protein n=1 Tax=Limnobaculum parvum TaxID=2172103 RepID=A0A2Y9TU90_9GAMM|nr:DUF596 domain-containing protein [Limnobaculum parvum]AWH87075.1 DUF596 domain-containing protein [Limnobaculum parvum]
MVTDDESRILIEYAETQALNGLWAYIAPIILPSIHADSDEYPFLERKEIFFWFLEKLLQEGRVKLAKKGVFLKGTVAEQIERFRQAFPKTEAEMDDGLWFFDETCPGGAVWVLEDGSLEWT